MTLTHYCPAKVNLALSVGPPQPNGYHPIASWMVAVDFYDDLTITPADHTHFDIAWAPDAPSPSPIDWPVEKDLVYRAHQLLEQHTGQPLHANIITRKRIPVGAGLAGGSSNGATALLALDETFELNLPLQTLIELSTQLGSDIPFFFTDGSAIVTGFGETITPAPIEEPIDLALILPPLHCNTASVYARFDKLSTITPVEVDRIRRAPQADPRTAPPFNDLAEPACQIEPKLAQLREQITHLTGRTVHLTGSGAAMFIVANHAEDARDLAARITAETETPTRACQTIA